MWKSMSPLYHDRGGCLLRSGARRRRHVTPRPRDNQGAHASVLPLQRFDAAAGEAAPPQARRPLGLCHIKNKSPPA